MRQSNQLWKWVTEIYRKIKKSSTYWPNHIEGIYRAKVVDSADPLKSGRVKVYIPDLMDGIENRCKGPFGIWAYPATAFTAPGPGQDFGSLTPPPVGSHVFVFFEDNDSNKPRYFAGCTLKHHVPKENTLGPEWWNKWTVLKTPEQRIFFTSDDPTDACTIMRGKNPILDRPIDNSGDIIYIWEANPPHVAMVDYSDDFIELDPVNKKIYVKAKYDIIVKSEAGNIYLEAWNGEIFLLTPTVHIPHLNVMSISVCHCCAPPPPCCTEIPHIEHNLQPKRK